MLKKTKRAAIIHPTGTGKSFIGMKLAEDHPGAHICWLSPSEYIYNTQIENLKAVTGGYAPDNINFITYAKLMVMNEEEMAAINPGFIVLDEFHRCGAGQWGKGVGRVLDTYPDVPVLGLSATNVRYLDNQRDMAEELFGGNVASRMSLGEAIVRDILHPPLYITSIYSCQKDIEKYQARIDNKKIKLSRDGHVKTYVAGIEADRSECCLDTAQKHLDALRRALDRAEGLEAVFQRHMKQKGGKYILFCSSIQHMREMIQRVPEWFSGIDQTPQVYSVHSDDYASRQEFVRFRQDDGPRLKLLFSIDMLNEGIHVDDVDGVILFRPTVSPIIYKQQIGRALSANNTRQPVIFDIVNNFENLYSISSVQEEMQEAVSQLREAGQEDLVVNESFVIIDEVRDCRQVFGRLQETLSASWDVMFETARGYYEEHGNLLVPRMYRSNHLSLGLWIETQRKVKKGAIPGTLTEERVARLESIGMSWEGPSKRNWAVKFQAALEYFQEHGDLAVDIHYVTPGGFRLGGWIASLRRWNNAGVKLTEERKRQLDSIGMIWDKYEYRWQRNYMLAKKYFDEHGNLDVPNGRKAKDGTDLAQWLNRMRALRSDGKLGQSQAERLSALGMRWAKKSDIEWERGYEQAREYFLERGNLDVPMGYRTDDGFELGQWVYSHRHACNSPDTKNSKNAVRGLTEERKTRLTELGMAWSPARRADLAWERNYQAVKDFCEATGSPPSSGQGDRGQYRLWQWLYRQRRNRKEARLRQAQIEMLDSLGVDSFWKVE